MQSYVQSSLENHNQPLDFTAKKINPESSILDLSCKKQQNQLHHQQKNQKQHYQSHVSIEMCSFSPSCEATTPNCNHSHQSLRTSYGDMKKSQIEDRTFMVTPPSESDSPKKLKFSSTYPKLNSSGANMSPMYSPLAMNVPLPSTPVLSNLIPNENITQIHMPAITTPQPIISTSTISSYQDDSMPLTSSESFKKGPRPFKAYSKDPLSMSLVPTEFVQDPSRNESYSAFRKRVLESVKKSNQGTNIKMRRISKSPTLPTSTMDDKDAAYRERRRKNNEAAKRSRDARRAKEDEIAIRAAFLEQENMQLKCELVALRNETAKLRCMVFTN